MDTQRKITEDNDQVYDTNYYTPLQEPIVESMANKVKLIVNKLYVNKHIDETTFKWLNNSQNPPRIPEFYTLTKIHKPNLASGPIVSGNGGPTERISSFIDSLLQLSGKKQESYIKDTTDFVRFIENTPIPDNAIIAILDVCSLYTNIPQEEGIKVVWKYYNDHYQPNPPIPTSTLGDLMKLSLILKENSFHCNGKHFQQTNGIAMGTKTAVAFSVIFMAHVEKQLFFSSPYKSIIWKRFIDDIFSAWTSSKQEIDSFIDFANRFHATIKFTCEMSSVRAVFLDAKFSKDHVSRRTKYSMSKHISKLQKRSNTRISLHSTPSA